MFDEPIGLGATPAVPLAASTAPTVSSSSWLEQQQLAEVLEEQLTGLEAIEVSDTVRVGTVLHATVRPTRYSTYLLTLTYARYSTHSSAYSIEVAIEQAMLDVETSEAIEEHRVDIQAIEEALART